LDARDLLERARERQVRALEQQLAREQRAVELSPRQGAHARPISLFIAP
jgi:hypothetical protein